MSLDGQELPWDGKAFRLTEEKDLIIPSSAVPTSQTFTLETKVKILPEKNLELSGFYRSGSAFCSQCEAEGFRRITFYLDRHVDHVPSVCMYTYHA